MVLMLAGLFVLVSLTLTILHSPSRLLFTAFVGPNLFQASLTGFCPLTMVLKTVGVKPGILFRV